ncbi:electron transport complex subunit RsxE [Psittacicella melopsittaci]|uniref:Ion-translocating oxidoreductase complex subunit E n=1 Tax=Psittacicella melopsittaci TaxID=2028576 RepID=A0A3A1Y633_9GAMM|nr:electron transport complex subunit E [Psittacicella melopsittaci]RIY33713.1 electron transport complex subunit RsxE [Psittacicella melopsittaci]
MSATKEIWLSALWKNNPSFVQLLGLCPLLATSTGATPALGLGICTMFVMFMSNTVISILRNQIPNEIRIPVFVLIIAALVTITQLIIHAFAFTLYESLGIFLPLIVTNCIVIGRIEAFAYKNKVIPSAVDGFAMGFAVALALVMLGAIRELLGQGTIFKDLNLILGPIAKDWYIQVYQVDNNFLLAILAPGAFITLGLLIAGKNYLNQRHALKTNQEFVVTTKAGCH